MLSAYWLLIFAVLIGAIAVEWTLRAWRRTFDEQAAVPSRCGQSGKAVACRLLGVVGLARVPVVCPNVPDRVHFARGEVQLSPLVYTSRSLAALAVAAHEVGHAEQFATGYLPCRLRAMAFRISVILTGVALLLLIAGVTMFSLPH